MARGILTVNSISRLGLLHALVAGDATNHHVFDNTGENVFIHVNNASGAPVTVTIGKAITTVDGMTLPAKTVSVAAGVEKIIGPFPKALYEVSSTGLTRAINVDLSVDTSITLGAFKLPAATY